MFTKLKMAHYTGRMYTQSPGSCTFNGSLVTFMSKHNCCSVYPMLLFRDLLFICTLTYVCLPVVQVYEYDLHQTVRFQEHENNTFWDSKRECKPEMF